MQFYKTQQRHFDTMVVINTSYSTTFNFPRININYPLIDPKKLKQKQNGNGSVMVVSKTMSCTQKAGFYACCLYMLLFILTG